MNETTFPLKRRNSKMRSSIRYGLVAVGALALMIGTFIALRPRLEQKVQAQTFNANQVAACDVTSAPSKTNDCLVISAFRENGPGSTAQSGQKDEFVEIFNASAVNVTVSTLSDDPNGTGNGIGVFVSAGMGLNPQFGQAQNASSLACQIKGATIIKARTWFLCGGQNYSLSNLGGNSGKFHSIPDAIIGTANAALATTDIPDDAGIALLNIGSNIVTQCTIGGSFCPTGFQFSALGTTGAAVVFDKVGFNPYGLGSPVNTGPGVFPGNLYPTLAGQYCEGTCLQPVGDASTVPQGPNTPCPGPGTGNFQNPPNPLYGSGAPTIPVGTQDPNTNFPVSTGPFIQTSDSGRPLSQILKCYGESGQYKIERRRSASTDTATAGQIYRDSWRSGPLTTEYPFNQTVPQPAVGACAGTVTSGFCGNSEDFILDAPNPASSNVGGTVTGVLGISSVLGTAGIHNCDSSFHNGYLDGTGCTAARPGGIAAYDGAGSAPIIGNTLVSLRVFDPNCASLLSCPGFANAERRYSQDASVFGAANDPLGILILRFRVPNLSGVAVAGGRFRLNDLLLPCGGQSYGAQGTAPAFGQTTKAGSQEARNLRGPNHFFETSTNPPTTPTPTCGTSGSNDGSDGVSAFSAVLKALNSPGEFVVDSTLTQQTVWGTVLEDTTVSAGNPLPGSTPAPVACTNPGCNPAPPAGAVSEHQPFGGGSDSSLVLNATGLGGTTSNQWPLGGPFPGVGSGANAAQTGSFNALSLVGTSGTLRVGFKFGIVKSGRFKITIGREIAGPTPIP